VGEAHPSYHNTPNTTLDAVSPTETQIVIIFDPIPKKIQRRDIGTENSFEKSVSVKAKIKLEALLQTNREYRTLDRMQIEFQNLRKFGDGLDETDGELFGKFLMENSSGLLSRNRTKKARVARVKRFFEGFQAMEEMKIHHPFFETMIEAIIIGGRKERKLSIEMTKAGERAKRASLLEDEHTRDEVREMATDIMAVTSTTKLTHPIRMARSSRSFFIKNAPLFAWHSHVDGERRREPGREL